MKENEKILTLHPEGKNGVRIDLKKYETMRDSILSSLKESGTATHTELLNNVRNDIGDNFEGSVMWFFETVKLDLEARGAIVRQMDKIQKKIIYKLS